MCERVARQAFSDVFNRNDSRKSHRPTKILNISACFLGNEIKLNINPSRSAADIISKATKQYRIKHPNIEIPFLNSIYNKTQGKKVYLSEINRKVLQDGDVIELSSSTKKYSTNYDENDQKISTLYDFSILFNYRPFGFLLKQENDKVVISTLNGSQAHYYERLVRGTQIHRINQTSIEYLTAKEVNHMIETVSLPVVISFRGSKKPPSTRLRSAKRPENDVSKKHHYTKEKSLSSKSSVSSNDKESDIKNQSDKSLQDVTSINNEPNGHKTKGIRKIDNVDGKSIPKVNMGFIAKALPIKQVEIHDNTNSKDIERKLVRQIEFLKKQLMVKKKEVVEIMHRLDLYQMRLASVRKKNGAIPETDLEPPSVKLTAELLRELDKECGSGRVIYLNSPVPSECSSTSTYSIRSSCSLRPDGSHVSGIPRPRIRTPTIRSTTSVSSVTSTYSTDRPNFKGKSKRQLFHKKKEPTSSLSNKGGVIPKARATRDTYIQNSDSPGVGYYNVVNKKRVQGGEIGDSSRDLPWP